MRGAIAPLTPVLPPDATGPTSRHPLRLDLSLDLQITLTGLVISAMHTTPVLSNMPLLDPRGINGMDRSVVGNRSTVAGKVSDATLAGMMVLPHVAGLLDWLLLRPDDGVESFAADSRLLLEAYAVSAIATSLVKHAVRRARPYLYDATCLAELGDSSPTLSFFSGHTSGAFAMATAYSYLFALRHPESPWKIPIWTATHGLAATTAFTRVLAGKHFWSDVLVGAVAGSGIGFLVPWLHRRLHGGGARSLVSEWRVTPSFYENNGLGVNVMGFF